MVRQLHVLGVTDDGDDLLLGPGTSSAKASHRIRLDDKLRAAVRGQLNKPRSDGHRAEIALTPKEIQARLRAGETPEEVAKAAQVPVARLMPYVAPVEAERQRIVDDARAAHLHRSRGPAGSRPLGETVDAHLGAVAGFKPESVDWSARRRRDAAWIVSLSYSARGGRRTASWLWRPLERDLTALDIAATRLAADETPSPRRAAPSRSTSSRPAATGRKSVAKRPAAKKAKRAPAKPAAKRPAAPSKAVVASKAATARKAAAAKKAATARKAAAKKAAAAGKAATTRTAAAAKKAATTKPAPAKTKATVKKTTAKVATKPAATRKPATKATKTTPARTAPARKTAAAKAPVRKAVAKKAATIRKAVTKKAPARKVAAAAATPPVPSKPFRPTLVESPPELAPVAQMPEPVVEPAVAPVVEPVAAPAAAAASAGETRPNVVVVPPPAATPRKAGQRVPVPSWSDVLLGVQPHRDDDASKG